MRLKFQNIFAGIGVGPRKKEGQTLVDGLALRVFEGQVVRFTSLQCFAAKVIGPNFQLATRHTHNAYCAAARRRRDGNDGILMAGQHGVNGAI